MTAIFCGVRRGELVSSRENFMAMTEQWAEWWSRFLDLPQDSFGQAIDILQQRYVEERQQRDRFNQHADKIHYPQFREKLLQISDEKTKYADRIAGGDRCTWR
jgi:hypothetical protein